MDSHDLVTMAQAWSAPGIDPRQWVSFATVDPETDGQKSVEFTDEYGPLVRCTLHPSAIPVVCRVAHEVAGNGEGEWFPFIAGDEVIVLIPEGSEDAGCVIIGRLNQEIDQWPKQVAGQDSTANTFAFRRLRTPYIVETASSYLIRNATTGAFIGISPTGAVTISNADNAFLALTANLIGMQNADGDVLMQIDVDAKQAIVEAAGTKLVLDASASSFLTTGTMNIGTSGLAGSGHAVTLEQVVNIISSVICQLATVGAFNPAGPFGLPAWTSSAPAPLIALWTTVLPAAASPMPVGAGGAPGGLLDALLLPELILAAFAAQLPDPAAFGLPSPVLPGIGRPGLLY